MKTIERLFLPALVVQVVGVVPLTTLTVLGVVEPSYLGLVYHVMAVACTSTAVWIDPMADL